jgi:hypothetical protein
VGEGLRAAEHLLCVWGDNPGVRRFRWLRSLCRACVVDFGRRVSRHSVGIDSTGVSQLVRFGGHGACRAFDVARGWTLGTFPFGKNTICVDLPRSNGYLGLYPIWLRRPRDTKAKWPVLENLKTGLTLLPKSASSKPPCLASSSPGHQSQMGYKPT